MPKLHLPPRFTACIATGLLGLPPNLYSNPYGPQVVAGSTQFQGGPGELMIQQGSQRAIIDWQGFSIDQGELTQFIQPGSNSAVLNRVISGNPSTIHGQLQADGQVYLINPNGILVGPTGQIDTAGFLASTLDVSNAEFLAGGDMRFRGESQASITNLGKVNSIDGGDVFLIARTIVNEGTLNAEGSVGLGAGSDILLKATGNERVAIMPGSKSGSINNRGIVHGTIAELKAAGGNEYALAINNKGIVRATGFQKRGGKLYLSAGGRNRVSNSGTLSASRSVEVKAPEIENSGTIDVSNQQDSAGTVTLLGQKITLPPSSLIIADGEIDGGRILIGGGPRGAAIEGETNAQFTTVAAGSRIQASGQLGNGGEVILWADDTMDFNGHIENTGGSKGGFTEVSGLRNLIFNGTVNTGGGELLLDPFNYVIKATEADSIVNALATNNVTIDTTMDKSAFGSSGNNTDAGDITVNTDILYDSTFNLTLLAVGYINFNASVQNSNDTGGDVYAVAGWDGTTAFDAATFLRKDVATTTLFGKKKGSIRIGNGNQRNGIAIGSRSGETAVFGHNIILQGSNIRSAKGKFAQLGFRANDKDADYSIQGSVSVSARNNVEIRGGSFGQFNYAQIGFVGADVTPEDKIAEAHINSTSPSNTRIRINANNNLKLTGGTGANAYAQLGNGGAYATGSFSGSIQANISNKIAVTGGHNEGAYAHLGHGGHNTHGNHSGTLKIEADNITLQGGGEYRSAHSFISNVTYVKRDSSRCANAYAQLGNGGADATGNFSGSIRANISNKITVTGGDSEGAYAHIGHGGHNANGNHSGDLKIEARNITLRGGGDSLGLSSSPSHERETNFFSSKAHSYAQIGNGGFRALGNHSGSLEIDAIPRSRLEHSATNNQNGIEIDIAGGSGNSAFALLGNGGLRADGNHNSSIRIDNADSVSVTSGTGGDAFAFLGSGGGYSQGVLSGEIVINNSGDISIQGTETENSLKPPRFAQIGFGGYQADGNHDGSIEITEVDNILIRGGSAKHSYALLGIGGLESKGNHAGNIKIEGTKDIDLAGGGPGAFALLGVGGHGSETTDTIGVFKVGKESSVGNLTGKISISNTNNICLSGSAYPNSFAHLGVGGSALNGKLQGEVSISHANNIALTSGQNPTAHAQIGFGGNQIKGNHEGSISIDKVNDIRLKANSHSHLNANSSAHIGVGGNYVYGNHQGRISINRANNIYLEGGSQSWAFAQIGTNCQENLGKLQGDITIKNFGNLSLTGHKHFEFLTKIGNGGLPDVLERGTASGNINIITEGSATLKNAHIGPYPTFFSNTSGNTWISVGGADNSQTLKSNQGSKFYSGTTGELRFYLPSSVSAQFDVGTVFNSTEVTNAGKPKNFQGRHAFGEGPYKSTRHGNFAFYAHPSTSDPGDFSFFVHASPINHLNFPLPARPTAPLQKNTAYNLRQSEDTLSPVGSPYLDDKLISQANIKHLNQLLPDWFFSRSASLIGNNKDRLSHLKKFERKRFGNFSDETAPSGLLAGWSGTSKVAAGTFKTRFGAKVTLNSDGSFYYAPETARKHLAKMSRYNTNEDFFTYVILDADDKPVGVNGVTIKVISVDRLKKYSP